MNPQSSDKPLVVIAELAGMSKSQLDWIEHGERALDKLSEIVALGNALQVAPGDLMATVRSRPTDRHAGPVSATVHFRPVEN